jgi:hypothetical protein
LLGRHACQGPYQAYSDRKVIIIQKETSIEEYVQKAIKNRGKKLKELIS